ncbi:hypothetical protein [Pseudobutyrivibrio sp.]
MSVPVPQRSHGKLEVNTMATELCTYTLNITDNENVFDRKHDTFIHKIQDTAIEIQLLCWEANNIKTGDSQDRYDRRIELQSRAIDQCNRLCALIEIAKRVFHLKTRRMIYWTDLVVALRNKIQSWKNSNVRDLRP